MNCAFNSDINKRLERMEVKVQTQSSYGLRNAADLLNRIRQKYRGEKEEGQQHNITFIEESLELEEYQPNKSKEEPIKNEESSMSLIKEKQKQNTFCDKLIVQTLQEKIEIYQQDLGILEQNKSQLYQAIELLTDRINKLKDIQNSNARLQAQNQMATQQLHKLIQNYHQSNQLLFKSKVNQQETYNSLRNKIRTLLKEAYSDNFYFGFAQHWNGHVHTMLQHQNVVKAQATFRQESTVKKIVVDNPSKGQEEVSLDQPKPKKKLTEAQKAMLLGDLKSFSKNFKFPNM